MPRATSPAAGTSRKFSNVFEDWNRRMAKNRNVWKGGKATLKGLLLPFEDQHDARPSNHSVDVRHIGPYLK